MKISIYKMVVCVFIFTSFSSCLKVVDKQKEALEKEMREKEQVEVVTESAAAAAAETEFHLRGETFLKEDLKIEADKVFIDSDVRIYTGPYQLQINSKKLIVKTGAKIQSFAEGDTATFNQKGLDGGLVMIKSESAVGELYVHMNGQNSGQGKGGYSFLQRSGGMVDITRPACNPSWGPDGGSGGEAHFDFKDSKDFLIHPQMSSGKGGPLGFVSYAWGVPNFKRAEEMQYYNHFKSEGACRGSSEPSAAGFLGKICINRNDGNPVGCFQ